MPPQTEHPFFSMPADAALPDCPSASTSMVWPVPVSHRLDQLVEAAETARTDRTELLGALVCRAKADKKALVRAVLSYRDAQARGVVIGVPDDAATIQVPRRPPGRRKKRPVNKPN